MFLFQHRGFRLSNLVPSAQNFNNKKKLRKVILCYILINGEKNNKPTQIFLFMISPGTEITSTVTIHFNPKDSGTFFPASYFK